MSRVGTSRDVVWSCLPSTIPHLSRRIPVALGLTAAWFRAFRLCNPKMLMQRARAGA